MTSPTESEVRHGDDPPEVSPIVKALFGPLETSAEASDGSSADYYRLPQGATELQDLISDRDMNAQIGELFRAAYRYGRAPHSSQLRDAKKMRFYIDAEIKRLEKLEMDGDE